MNTRRVVKIQEVDNVAIAVEPIAAGTQVDCGLTAREDIPQAHKIALCDIAEGAPVIRYGVVLGYAKEKILKGSWINEFMLDLPVPPALSELEFATEVLPYEKLPDPTAVTWEGYENPDGWYAGTRNILGISTTVGQSTHRRRRFRSGH